MHRNSQRLTEARENGDRNLEFSEFKQRDSYVVRLYLDDSCLNLQTADQSFVATIHAMLLLK